MPRRCTVCDHPRRSGIDEAFVGASLPYRGIAERYGLSFGATWRHIGAHIPALLVEAAEAEDAAEGESLLDKVREVVGLAHTWHSRAESLNTAAAGLLATELEAVEANWDAEVQEAEAGKKPPTARARRAMALGRAKDIAAARRRWAADVDGSVRLGLAAVRELARVLKLLGLTTGELRQEPLVQVNVLVQSITALDGAQRVEALRQVVDRGVDEFASPSRDRRRALIAEALAPDAPEAQ